MNIKTEVARGLLSIGAVFFRPNEPFTWASGIKSPIYCDNRLTLTAPAVRTRVEEGLTAAFASLQVASAIMSPEMLEQALLYPKQSVELDVTYRNVMSVNVPVYHFHTANEDPTEIYPYGFAQTSGELDAALEALGQVFRDMLELAEVEKTMQLLSQDIEKTRRRVNALEYVVIPEMQRNIRYITMKLDENERGNTTRLMKVKDMVLQDAHNYQ